MNLFQINKGTKQFGNKVLFDHVSFAINEGEHVGVIGPNGAGKTTLFKILVGQETLDDGELVQAKNLRMGYLEQEAEWVLEQTVEEYLSQNLIKPLWELKQLGIELGLTHEDFSKKMRTLSGGFRMRAKLLYLIGQEPNLMLLDEPTNFLDLESVLALERFLQNYAGAFLLISHDREFLRRSTESTLEVEGGDITKFPGNIDDYFEQKSQLRETMEAQAANLEAKRKHIESFIERFRAKATKARQAQSRMKLLEKMEKIELKDLPIKALIKIPAPIHTGKESISLQNAQLGYGNNIILKNINLRAERGAHLGIVGHNGVGKSTLLKSLARHIPILAGELNFGHNVTFSYFAQHSTEVLDLNSTVLESLQSAAHPDVKAQEILNLAGALLFAGDHVHKPIKILSGGEKSRVALGQILLKKSPLLLLDEPTNHLDFDTVEALTEALRDYEGTIVVVSHDRSFIGRIATQIIEIHDGSADIYPGTYDDYVWSLEKGALSTRIKATPIDLEEISQNVPQNPEENLKFNYKAETKKLQSEIRDLGKQISAIENELNQLSKNREELTSLLIKSQGAEAQKIAIELNTKSQSINRLEEELLDILEKQDHKQKILDQIRGQ